MHAVVIGLLPVAPRAVAPTVEWLEARIENPVARMPRPQARAATPPARSRGALQVAVAAPAKPVREPEASPPALPDMPPPGPLAEPPPAASGTVSTAPASAAVAPRPHNPEPARQVPGLAVDIPLAADSHYYAAKELDVPPRPLHKIEPLYPQEYERQGTVGHAVLEVRIEADGQVSDLKLAELFPMGHDAFGREALAALRHARFVPARRDGQAVRAVLQVKVVFEMDD